MLILKEGATLRLAGIMVGVFVLLEMLLFQQWISLIPNAVFAGLLFKVGWDVFDWLPVRRYTGARLDDVGLSSAWLRRPLDPPLTVTHTEVLFIAGTTAATIVSGAVAEREQTHVAVKRQYQPLLSRSRKPASSYSVYTTHRFHC